MQHFTFPQFLILTIAWLSLCLATKAYEVQRFHQQANADGTLSFLVVGDWGRRGQFNQSIVAKQMGIVGGKIKANFVISTGDNFYDAGLKGPKDPNFNESFTNIYTAKSLQIPWLVVLGNHDYWGDALSQVKSEGRWFCWKPLFITHTTEPNLAEFYFVDTTPFVDKYFTDPKEHVYDWRGVLPREAYLSFILENLDVTLRNSTEKWKVVVGHHTIRSAGHHGNTNELVTRLLPILKANKIDFYINGHDHCLEHISDLDSNIEFFTSGGGSKAWRGDIKPWDPKELKLYYDGQGFMSVQMTKTYVDIQFYDVFGKVLHKWSKSKEDLVMHRKFTIK